MTRSLLSLILAAVPALAFGQAGAKMPDPDPELERKIVRRRRRVRGQPVRRRPAAGQADPDELRPAGPALGRVQRGLPADQAGPEGQRQDPRSSKTPTATARPTRPPSSPTACSSPPASSPATAAPTSPTAPSCVHLSAGKPGGKADKTRVVLSGFGTEDTHHILHTLRWGPDGVLYFNQSIYIHSHIETPHGVERLNGGGIWRFRPGDEAAGRVRPRLVNPWGHHFDR